jgi:hypothetical protein
LVNKTLFHGSNLLFQKFDDSKARIQNDLYGGGVAYFTTSEQIAEGYAKSMYKSAIQKKLPNALEIIYRIDLTIGKLFDVEDTFTGKDLTQFYKRTEVEQFARGAGLLYYGVDKYDVMSQLDEGDLSLSGDEVFKGLSGGMNRTAAARDKLKSLGYTTLKYVGGLLMGVPRHDVYLAYYAKDIKMVSYKIGKPLNPTGFK